MCAHGTRFPKIAVHNVCLGRHGPTIICTLCIHNMYSRTQEHAEPSQLKITLLTTYIRKLKHFSQILHSLCITAVNLPTNPS